MLFHNYFTNATKGTFCNINAESPRKPRVANRVNNLTAAKCYNIITYK